MNKCKLFCTNTQKTIQADVLEQSKLYLKAVIDQTDITVTMKRKDTQHPYVGSVGRLIFETNGCKDLK